MNKQLYSKQKITATSSEVISQNPLTEYLFRFRQKLYLSSLLSLASFSSLFLALASSLTLNATAAERLILRLGPFQQSVQLADLEEFAQNGTVSPQLQPYSPFLTAQLRQALSKRLQFEPSLAERFIDELLDSSEGEQLITQLKKALPGSNIELLKSALGLAIRQGNNVTALSLLRAYPREELTVDLTSAVGIMLQFNASNLESQLLSPILSRELNIETETKFKADFEPTILGETTVFKRTLILTDSERRRNITVDIYYNKNNYSQAPLIVMSHGFAADRNFLKYLAIHLASYGFTIASLEHPGSNVHSLNDISVGISLKNLLPASEFIDRPKDISFLLDELAKINQEQGVFKGKFNTDKVTVIGHSFGGYTALALAGAELDPKASRSFCQQLTTLGRSPADWLQCAATELPYSKIAFRDPRVIQVIAFNPITGKIFGEDGLKQVHIPTLILSSSEDAITPSIEHQLKPFQELRGEKYLVVAVGATHMSITDISNLNSPMGQSTLVKEIMGEEAEPVRQLAKGISLAFIQQLTPEANQYESFLTSAYVQSLSTTNMQMRLAKSELPSSIEHWLSMISFGKEQIVLDRAKTEVSFLAKIKKSLLNAQTILTKPEFYQGQLDRIFTSMMYNYNQNPDRLS